LSLTLYRTSELLAMVEKNLNQEVRDKEKGSSGGRDHGFPN